MMLRRFRPSNALRRAFGAARFWCAGLVLAAVGANAQNVSVTDYVVPESQAERLVLDFRANHSTKGEDTTGSGGNIGAVYKKFYDSLPFGYTVDFIGSGAVDKDVGTSANPGTGDYEGTYKLNGAGSIKQYVFGRMKAGGGFGGFLSDFFGSVRFNADMEKDFDQPALSATLGIGYGRFINATALAKAVRIEQFLRQEEEITGDLPKETLLEIGHVVERRAEYEDLYGSTYKKRWYADIEDAIRKAGLLQGENLGAAGILRIDEVIEREPISDRFYGWDIIVGTKFDILLSDELAERPPANLDVTMDYARPISWKWQVNERLQGNSPFEEMGKSYSGSLASDITYEVSNRIDFRLRHLITVDKLESRGETEVSNSGGVSFIYYLENAVNLTLSESIEKPNDDDLRTSFSAVLNYRIF